MLVLVLASMPLAVARVAGLSLDQPIAEVAEPGNCLVGEQHKFDIADREQEADRTGIGSEEAGKVAADMQALVAIGEVAALGRAPQVEELAQHTAVAVVAIGVRRTAVAIARGVVGFELDSGPVSDIPRSQAAAVQVPGTDIGSVVDMEYTGTGLGRQSLLAIVAVVRLDKAPQDIEHHSRADMVAGMAEHMAAVAIGVEDKQRTAIVLEVAALEAGSAGGSNR